MGVKFLSAEWAQVASDALLDHPGLLSLLEGAEVSLQFTVRAVAGRSSADYYIKVAGGKARIEIGTLPGADISVKTNYTTAAAISKGELNIQKAFFKGELKITGNVAKLMLNQQALARLSDAVSSLDVEY